MQRSNQLTSASTPPSRGKRKWCPTASLALVLALGGSTLVSGSIATVAHAQSNPQQLAEVNKKAMEDYNNLEIEKSKAALEKAAKNAEKSGIRGPALARTYSNLAVVLIGGLGDHKAAINAFTRALKEDPKVEPDPIVATPEVVSAYNAAKANTAKGEPVAEDEPEPEPEKVVVGPVEGNLDHTPAAEQLTQTAVPIFVKKSDDLEIANVKVFYRSLGMKKPKSHELTETDDGYSYLIPCTDVFEPKVEYFIVASDAAGNPVGNSGTSEAPITVPVVASRTEAAPSLPGQVPPSQCASDDECPPGSPGCGGSAGMGDACSSDNDCQSGLACDDDVCITGERASSGDDDDEDEESSSSSSSRGGKKVYVDANIGVALVYVGSGRAADRSPKAAVDEVSKMGVDAAQADRLLQARGFDCATSTNDNGQLVASNCAVAVNPGGFVAVPVLNLAVGYRLTPKLGAAVTGRFQIGSGEGPLAGIQLGLRGEYLLTKPADDGLELGVLAGLAVGQIQAQPPAKGSLKGPYATNAKLDGVGMGINVGAKIGYRINKTFGLNVLPVMHIGLPNFLFALDLTAGAEVNFF
jgi:hypothetical protein